MWGYLLALGVGYICARIHEKSDKIARIHKTIAEHSPGFVTSWLKTVQTVAKIQWDGIHDTYVRKIKSTTHIAHDTFEIEYHHKGRWYRIRIRDSVKVRASLNVYDQNGRDITNRFLEFFGPEHDFHKNKYTPRDMGCSKIVIIDGDLNESSFNENEIITVVEGK